MSVAVPFLWVMRVPQWQAGTQFCRSRLAPIRGQKSHRRPRTSKPEPGHKVYPYLLRGIVMEGPNQVDGYHLHPDGAR